MARPQEFDTAQALRAAMHVFWSKGFEAASLADIMAATGLSKSSLYATFGDKRSLFLAAFSAYQAERMAYMERALDDGRPARQSLKSFLGDAVAHIADPAHGSGCMTANEAVELAPHDVEVQRLVAEDFQALEDAFTRAVARGQADGSIASPEDPRKLGRFLVVGFQGLQVMARAQSDRPRLDDTVAIMMAALD